MDYFIGNNSLILHGLRSTYIKAPIYDSGTIIEEPAFPVLSLKHRAIAAAFARELKKRLKPGNTYLIQH